jgi:hypothetical protein
MKVFKPITAPYLTLYIKPRIFAKRQCKLQWLTPPNYNTVFRVEVLEIGVLGSRFGVHDSWSIAHNLGFRVEGLGFRV